MCDHEGQECPGRSCRCECMNCMEGNDSQPDRPLPDNGYYRAMASGHANRKGHKLEAVLADNGDGTWSVKRSCCPEGE